MAFFRGLLTAAFPAILVAVRSSFHVVLVVLLLALLAWGCGRDRHRAFDAAVRDAASMDASVVDAEPSDAGTDAGEMCADPPPGPARADVMTLATAGPGGALALGMPCDAADNQCAPGTLCCQPCCQPAAAFACAMPDAEGSCPLPDVWIVPERIAATVSETTQTFGDGACEIDERCVIASGTRRLLNFEIQIVNDGTADMHIGPPDPSNPNFDFENCHGHAHYEGYGEYRLLRPDNCLAAPGHKNGFCVLDLSPWEGGGRGQYNCADQGISMGWSDVYAVGTPCQWIDITDVPPGEYILEATVNPERDIPESDWTNNTVQVPVTITGGGVMTDAGPGPDITDPCWSGSGEAVDCGWTVAGDFPCTAGATVTVGCNADCAPAIGDCTGDSVLRLCVGPGNTCASGAALASNDDECGSLCSRATATCPATGMVTVMTAPYTRGEMYTCNVVMN